MRHLLGVMILLAAVIASVASAQPLTLRYCPQTGQKWCEKLSGEVTDVAMQGQSVGIPGCASADVASEITGADAATKSVDLKLTMSNIEASLNGQDSKPNGAQCLAVQVDETGCMTMADDAAKKGLSFLETGAIPLQVVNVLAHTVRFSEEPVKQDDEWTFEDRYTLPDFGAVPINTRWKLLGCQGKVVTLGSTALAALPDFKAPNPMAPGTEIDIQNVKVTLTEAKQEYDTGLSRVLKAEGKLRIDGKAVLQGMQIPVCVSLKYTLEPAEAPKEPAR